MKAPRSSSTSSRRSSVAPSPAPESQVFDGMRIKQEMDDYSLSLPTPQSYNSPSIRTMTYSPSQSPSQPSLCFDDDSLATSPDMTQHPAEMLCDLQCQSAEVVQAPSTQPTTLPAPPFQATPTPSSLATRTPPTSTSAISSWHHHLAPSRRTTLNFPLLSPTHLSPTSPMTSLLTPLLISKVISRMKASVSPMTTRAPSTRRPNIVRSLSLSSPPLARLLDFKLDATGRTLRGKTSILAGWRLRGEQGNGSEASRQVGGRNRLVSHDEVRGNVGREKVSGRGETVIHGSIRWKLGMGQTEMGITKFAWRHAIWLFWAFKGNCSIRINQQTITSAPALIFLLLAVANCWIVKSSNLPYDLELNPSLLLAPIPPPLSPKVPVSDLSHQIFI